MESSVRDYAFYIARNEVLEVEQVILSGIHSQELRTESIKKLKK
jgi:hypothetical protein